MPFATINPATGKTEKVFPSHTPEEVDRLLHRAVAAFADYRTTSYAERSRHLITTAELMEGEVPDLAWILTTEMGKTFPAAKAEVAKCAVALRWFAANAERLLADEHIETAAKAARSYVHYQPLGPVLAIMPWNFPMWQVIRFAGPALMVGNVGLLKHASNVPQTALAIEDLFRRAGLPEGAFQTLLVESKDVAAIIEDPRVAAVTLTGSERAGMSVAATAGHALKKTVLELGGSDPFIVLPSADLNACVRTAVTARVQNNGQSCIAAKRFIVHGAVHDEFLARFTRAMDALVVGDPFDSDTDVGPIVSEAQRDELLAQVEAARAEGATVHAGGKVPDADGWWFPPTVLSDVNPDMDFALPGDLRARRHGVPGPRRRHRVGGGELDELRPGVERVDERRGGAAAVRRGDRGRRGVRERHGGLHARDAFRGDQALGLRSRALRGRPQGIRQRQDGMGRLTTYLDYAATAPMRAEVREAMAAVLADAVPLGNPTGGHPSAQRARRLLEDARDDVAAFLARDPGEIVFTSGGTESANLAVLGTVDVAQRTRGEAVVLCSAVEHPAVLESCRAAATGVPRCAGCRSTAPGSCSGTRSPAPSSRAFALVAVMAANNETGVVQPLREVVEEVRRRAPQAAVFTDAVQAASFLDVAELTAGADLVSLAAHKVGGPVGTGVLAVSPRVALEPRQYGGGQERERRSGTQDVVGAVGLATALRLAAADRDGSSKRVAALRDRLAGGLASAIPDLHRTVSAGVPTLPGHLHVCLPGVEREELLVALGREGVCVSGGSSCASGALEPSHVLTAMGVSPALAEGAVRFTLGRDTSDEDVDRALVVVPATVEALRRLA